MSEYGRGGKGYFPLWGSRKDPHRRAVRHRPYFPRVSVSVSLTRMYTPAHCSGFYSLLRLGRKAKQKEKHM